MAVATSRSGYVIADAIVELRETLPESATELDSLLSTFFHLLGLPLVIIARILYFLAEAFFDTGTRYILILDFISTVGTKALLNFTIIPRFFHYPKYCLIMGYYDFSQYFMELLGHSYIGIAIGIAGCVLAWRKHEDSRRIWIGITVALMIWLTGEMAATFMEKIIFQSL